MITDTDIRTNPVISGSADGTVRQNLVDFLKTIFSEDAYDTDQLGANDFTYL